MSGKIFISYRREDGGYGAGRIADHLAHEFGRDRLFVDVDNIPLGENFVKILSEEVGKCDVLLAIIGPNWLNMRDDRGKRRLDNPTDFVRVEIRAALERGVPVIPVLLDGAAIPDANKLPEDLKELHVRNGLPIRHASFAGDVGKLIRDLKRKRPQVESEPELPPQRVGPPLPAGQEILNASKLDGPPQPDATKVEQPGGMFSAKIVHTPRTAETTGGDDRAAVELTEALTDNRAQEEVEQHQAEKPRSDGEQNVAAVTISWKLVLLRGIAAIVVGVLVVDWTGLTTAELNMQTLRTLVVWYGLYAFVDGALALIAAFTGGAKPVHTWWLIAVGLAGIAAGLAIGLWPGITARVLIVLIGVWAIARGVFEIIGWSKLREEIDTGSSLSVAGLMSVMFGIFLLVEPEAGRSGFVWSIAVYSVVFGIILVGFSLRLRRHRHA
jgi:uncharacterized membrane protein HdeD (DUF308 family)